ncbi:MAG: glycerophosphodiester phosphodiesterase family protein [Pseudomonadota bacterium]
MRFAPAALLTCALALGACSQPPLDPDRNLEAEAIAARWLEDVSLPALLDCARESNATFLQAHRAGPRTGYAENALSTIRASLEDGALFVELDVIETGDGALILMHDRTLDRTTTGTGPVTDATLAEIQALSLEDAEGHPLAEAPPTLAEALALLDGIGFAMLDLKGVSERHIVEAVREADALDRVILIAYTGDQALAMHQAAPEALISVGLRDDRDLERLTNAGVDENQILAWLGLGQGGEPAFDESLAERSIETSFGDFRAEREGQIDYIAMKDAGAEVISVDNVPAAARALRAGQQARGVLASCPAARMRE